MKNKLTALKRFDGGVSLKTIAREYGVGVSTVSEWRKNREQIEKWNSILNSPAPNRKTMKTSDYETIDKALYLWFTQQRARGIPLSGPILQQKAVEISEDLPISEAPLDFKASQGWLSRWKTRHGVRELQICGEKLSADVSAVQDFKQKFKKILEDNNYSLDQLYNCDETGLYYKMVPSKTLAGKDENCAPGYKKNKERVTILACSNSSGRHKLRLMCIGKSAKPRAFKHMGPNVLPLYYKNQRSAWMNTKLFKNWFFEEFVPAVNKFLKKSGQPIKALLLIDNAPSHLTEEELRSEEIRVMFLPPNVTSLIQPMDQGVIETLKKIYRRSLLEYVLQRADEGENLSDCLKKVNLRDVVYSISDAWNNIKDTTLLKSWNKIIDNEASTEVTSDNNDIYELVAKIDELQDVTTAEVDAWLKMEKNDGEELSTTDLIELTHPQNDGNDLKDEELAHVSHRQGMESLQQVLIYVEQQEEATPTDVLLIKRWRDIAAKKFDKSKSKQLTLDSFVA